MGFIVEAEENQANIEFEIRRESVVLHPDV